MVRFLKAYCKYLGTFILPALAVCRFFCSDPEFFKNLTGRVCLKSPESLCLACLPGPLQRCKLFIPIYCLAFWSPVRVYTTHLAGLFPEPDCSSSALCSFFPVLSEAAKEITVEMAGGLFSASVCCGDQHGGVLETAMIAWKSYRQLSLSFCSQLFQCQCLCF